MKRILMVLVVLSLIFGCVCPATGGGEGNVTGQNSSGGNIVVVTNTSNSGGMSDPSKCNNLPPQQMADCLEQAMGN